MGNKRRAALRGSIFRISSVALCLTLAPVHQAPGQTPQTRIQVKTDFEAGKPDVFQAIMRLATESRVPLGMIRLESQSLCAPPERASYKNIPILDIVSDLLSGTAQTASYRQGVIEIRPKLIPEKVRGLLSMKFDDFYGPSTTAQGLGTILSGYITARLHPGGAYAGNILENTSSEHVEPFHLRNVSVEEILDYIVSQGTRGLWLMYPKGESAARTKSTDELNVSIYAYKDDSSVIEQLTCVEK